LALSKEAFAECFFGTRQRNFFAECFLFDTRQSLLCRVHARQSLWRSAKKRIPEVNMGETIRKSPILIDIISILFYHFFIFFSKHESSHFVILAQTFLLLFH
jgi:hypothetical protein